MATETLSSSQLGDRRSWPEAARTLVRRLRLPRQKVNERSDASFKARIEELEAQLAKAEASAASHRARLRAGARALRTTHAGTDPRSR